MSTPIHTTVTPSTRTAPRAERAVRAALVVAVLLALGDLAAGAALIGSDPAHTRIGVLTAVPAFFVADVAAVLVIAAAVAVVCAVVVAVVVLRPARSRA